MYNKDIKETLNNLIEEQTKRNKDKKEITRQRKESNKELLNILTKYIKTNPDTRFIQALWALKIIDRQEDNIIDRYYEEPDKTLERIRI